MSYRTLAIDFQGKQITVGLSPTLLNGEWGIPEADENNALLAVGRVIIASHDYSRPLESEYMYTTDNAETSLDRMLDWIKRNRP